MNARAIATLFLATTLLACGGEVGDVDEVDAVGTTTSALWRVSAGAAATNRTWNSGNSNNLSSWQSVDCVGNVGGDNELITSIRAYKEPSSNLDNFVAKLGQTCTNYETLATELYGPDSGTSVNANVFTGPNFRSGVLTSNVPLQVNTVATGVRLVVNTNSYVKDIRVRTKSWSGTTFNTTSSVTRDTATGYGGSNVTLDCPTGYVLTGQAVRYSTNTGKIRRYRIHCHELEWL